MSRRSNKLIVFFIPPEKGVNGGILSIFSICKESRQFKDVHLSDVLISTYPGTESYRKNDMFENDEEIFSFEEITKLYPRLESLILHIPEYAIRDVRQNLEQYKDYLSSIPSIQINIMNQNIELMMPTNEVASLFSITGHITQTTAHIRYTTQELSDQYGIPTHLLSVSIDPTQYKKLPYHKKQNVIAYSPDNHSMKQVILDDISDKLPGYKLVEVRDMSYGDFKNLAVDCRFMITFGEGFDGYLIETTFSGGIAFAVYNEQFFPSPDYKKLLNIYPNYEALLEKIVKDIKRLENADSYDSLNAKNYEPLSKIYSYKKYINNIEKFYRGEYTFLPDPDALVKSLGTSIQIKDVEIEGLKYTNEHQKVEIEGLKYTNKELQQIIESMTNSRSWKITKPLREINKKRPTK